MAQEEVQKSADVAVPVTKKPMTDKEVNTIPTPVAEQKDAPPASDEKAVPEKEESPVVEAEKSVPVKEEETAVVAEKVIVLTAEEVQKKSLEEFKELVREALNKREFTAPPTPVNEEKPEEKKPEEETKTEEKKTEEKKEETSTEVKAEEEKPVVPAAAPAETKTEEKAATETTEKASGADEDGTKTVEAIEESIVSVSPPESAAAPVVEETIAVAEAEPVEPEEVSIWGVPLLQDERSDVILTKFLRARDFKVKEALTMLKNTVQWRKENKIDELVESGGEEEASEFEKMVFAHGVDKEGHAVIYSSYGEFQNKELFSDKEKLNKFLNWRIQLQEKCVRAIDFSNPEAKSSFVFVSDFRNAPGLGKRALWQFIRRAVKQFEDNYPEFAARELFINVPWWYIPYYKTFGSIITSPRTRSKMVLAGPSKSAETIFKYIAPEQVPVKYGGLSKEVPANTVETVTEVIVKPAGNYTIELPASEACTLSWELRVLGADVSYGAQFEPTIEGSYAVIVSKTRKIGSTDEPVITDSFKVGEPGKIVITIDNQTSKKKKVLYRFKTQPKV
ncbi:PREDICTED: patellin-1-like isoform X1 [Camelina sativa]|uniref:Patellin-1-like isoform X1 n=1 Tax=Camelina sativa TaxID=90675 RepID=A0ABM0STL4_CAMSA|nr:PREDICTED: patellin-1-like isoform X1 [Camelina sativa]